MTDAFKAFAFVFMCYGIYHAGRELYEAARRDAGQVMYRAAKQAAEDVLMYDSEILLRYPPEAKRNYRSN